METLKNLVIILSYAVVSLAVALLLPAVMEISVLASVVAGFMVFICAAQLHGLYSRRIERAEIENELFELHQDQEHAIRELDGVRENISRLTEYAEKGAEQRSEKMIAEIKVLESLLAQVASRSRKRELQAAGIDAPSADTVEDGEVLGILRIALKENRVDLHLQPMVSLPQRKVRHYEAFSRVRDEIGRVIYPRQFLQVAHESGLISTLDNLLLFRCIQVIRQLRNKQPEVRFFCNISATSLRDPDFFPQFLDYMGENQNLSQRLVFEFPQSDVDALDEDLGAGLEALGKLGYQFSMDHVRHLNFDLPGMAAKNFKFVKIPVELFLSETGDIHAGDLKEALNRHVIDLVIEFIEDEQILVDVLDYNVDYGQGYLFGEPKPSRLEGEARPPAEKAG